jgi:hypothetical protein
MRSRRFGEGQQLPRREVLESVAQHYHHLQNEHKRAATESGTRRRIEERLLEVRERFDRLLAEWVPEGELKDAWSEYLHNRRPEPEGPEPIRPLVFRGVSDAGAVVEIRGDDPDELDVEIDGSPVARVAAEKDLAEKDLATRVAPAVFRLDWAEFQETFGASDEAVEALADFVATDDAPPPWDHAAELLAEGLVDTHLALTPRGRRALARRAGG